MHSLRYFWQLSHQIYNPHKLSGRKRALTFFVRAATHRSHFERLYAFFHDCPPLRGFLETRDPHFQEVLCRVFLFKNSTVEERLTAILQHFTILRRYFRDDVIHHLYWTDEGYTLWQSPDKDLPLTVRLVFDTGQRKEGFLSLYLYYEQTMVYHFNFRFAYDHDDVPALYIGTLQGSKEGLPLAKVLTKKLFGYRPKGFLLYLLRLFVQTLGIHTLYAITDEGFYTNSHLLRGNRSKKTNLNPFWLESGACPAASEQWYFQLPIVEKRRTYAELKSQKRNLFRKRYLLLDQIAPAYVAALRALFRPGVCPEPSAWDEALLPKPAAYDPLGPTPE